MKGTTTQDRLWTGSFLRICLVNLFIFVNFHALLPTFTFFVTYLGGDAVTIRGFGTFQTKQRKAKPARNINTGETILVPARKVVVFKPSKDFNADKL